MFRFALCILSLSAINTAFAEDYVSTNVGTMREIPAGSYTNGVNKIDVAGFHIGVTEVTGEQYKKVMGVIPSDPKHVHFSATLDNAPVGNVSVFDMFIFCNKLSTMEGLIPVYTIAGTTQLDQLKYPTSLSQIKVWYAVETNTEANGYKLPVESEWNWAAMGATDTFLKEFAGDPNPITVGDDAWKYGWTHNRSMAKTRKVCTKLPNELGLCDMVGNITEVVLTPYKPLADWYLVKGGSVNSTQMTSSIAFQRGVQQGIRSWWNGFRLVRK